MGSFSIAACNPGPLWSSATMPDEPQDEASNACMAVTQQPRQQTPLAVVAGSAPARIASLPEDVSLSSLARNCAGGAAVNLAELPAAAIDLAQWMAAGNVYQFTKSVNGVPTVLPTVWLSQSAEQLSAIARGEVSIGEVALNALIGQARIPGILLTSVDIGRAGGLGDYNGVARVACAGVTGLLIGMVAHRYAGGVHAPDVPDAPMPPHVPTGSPHGPTLGPDVMHGPGLPMIEGPNGQQFRDLRAEVHVVPYGADGSGWEAIIGNREHMVAGYANSSSPASSPTVPAGSQITPPVIPHYARLTIVGDTLGSDYVLLNGALKEARYSEFTYDGEHVLLSGGYTGDAMTTSLLQKLAEVRGTSELPTKLDMDLVGYYGPFKQGSIAEMPGRTYIGADDHVYITGTNQAKVLKTLESNGGPGPHDLYFRPTQAQQVEAVKSSSAWRFGDSIGYELRADSRVRVTPQFTVGTMFKKASGGE